MQMLFVLVPENEVEALLEQAFGPSASRPKLSLLRYPRASGERHLLSLIRAGRDRRATQWLPGMLKAVVLGAALGALTNGVLSAAFGMFGGMVGIAVGLGLLLGAFLGGFTALMTGTEVARPELRQLAKQVQDGDVLLQLVADDRALCERLRASGEARGRHALAVTCS